MFDQCSRARVPLNRPQFQPYWNQPLKTAVCEETAGGGDKVFMSQGSGSHKTVVLRIQLVHLDSNCGSWNLTFDCPANESSNLGRAGTFVYSLRAIADAVHFF